MECSACILHCLIFLCAALSWLHFPLLCLHIGLDVAHHKSLFTFKLLVSPLLHSRTGPDVAHHQAGILAPAVPLRCHWSRGCTGLSKPLFTFTSTFLLLFSPASCSHTGPDVTHCQAGFSTPAAALRCYWSRGCTGISKHTDTSTSACRAG